MYERYTQLRDAQGLTDYTVATTCGINESTFYDWLKRAKENPDAEMTLSNAVRLARFFHVSVETFLHQT